MSSVYAKVGRQVRELRLEAGLTQEDLAEKADISVSFLSFLENGVGKGSLQTYANLAAAFGMDLGDMLQDRSKKKPAKSAQAFPPMSPSEAKAIITLVKVFRQKPQS